jgi:hypothetical protein
MKLERALPIQRGLNLRLPLKPGRRSATKLLTREETRRIANVAKCRNRMVPSAMNCLGLKILL